MDPPPGGTTPGIDQSYITGLYQTRRESPQTNYRVMGLPNQHPPLQAATSATNRSLTFPPDSSTRAATGPATHTSHNLSSDASSSTAAAQPTQGERLFVTALDAVDGQPNITAGACATPIVITPVPTGETWKKTENLTDMTKSMHITAAFGKLKRTLLINLAEPRRLRETLARVIAFLLAGDPLAKELLQKLHARSVLYDDSETLDMLELFVNNHGAFDSDKILQNLDAITSAPTLGPFFQRVSVFLESADQAIYEQLRTRLSIDVAAFAANKEEVPSMDNILQSLSADNVIVGQLQIRSFTTALVAQTMRIITVSNSVSVRNITDKLNTLNHALQGGDSCVFWIPSSKFFSTVGELTNNVTELTLGQQFSSITIERIPESVLQTLSVMFINTPRADPGSPTPDNTDMDKFAEMVLAPADARSKEGAPTFVVDALLLRCINEYKRWLVATHETRQHYLALHEKLNKLQVPTASALVVNSHTAPAAVASVPPNPPVDSVALAAVVASAVADALAKQHDTKRDSGRSSQPTLLTSKEEAENEAAYKAYKDAMTTRFGSKACWNYYNRTLAGDANPHQKCKGVVCGWDRDGNKVPGAKRTKDHLDRANWSAEAEGDGKPMPWLVTPHKRRN